MEHLDVKFANYKEGFLEVLSVAQIYFANIVDSFFQTK